MDWSGSMPGVGEVQGGRLYEPEAGLFLPGFAFYNLNLKGMERIEISPKCRGKIQ